MNKIIAMIVLVGLAAVAVVLYRHRPLATPVSAIAPAEQGAQAPAQRVLTPVDSPHPLPTVQFVDGGGQARSLADFRGKVVLLNLWATWCTPCRKEMPALDRLQARLGGPGFEVVALSMDSEGLAPVQAFYRELGLKTLRVYLDESGDAAQALGVVGIPTTLLVDRQGREVGRKVGPAEWDSEAVMAEIRRYVGPP